MSPLVDAAPPPAAQHPQPLYELAPGLSLARGGPGRILNVYLLGTVVLDSGVRWSRRRLQRQLAGRRLTAHALTQLRSGTRRGTRRGPGRRWRQQRLDALSQRIGQESVHTAGHGWEHPRDEPPGLSSRPTAVPECPLRPQVSAVGAAAEELPGGWRL